ncbi:MAG TPA: SRPBCC family protein [Microlunatus sp.]|nr:SRPBCC family protein [Microlunatus sp.]
MSSVHQSVEVDVPVSTAYNQWTQFESFPQFMDGVDEIEQLSPTRSRWVVTVAGATRQFTTEVTEQVPDEVIAWRSVDGDTGGHTGRVTFEPLGPQQTRVGIDLGWEPKGVAEKAGALFNIDQRQIDASARDFKEFIEAQGRETGAWRGSV